MWVDGGMGACLCVCVVFAFILFITKCIKGFSTMSDEKIAQDLLHKQALRLHFLKFKSHHNFFYKNRLSFACVVYVCTCLF